MPKILTTYFTHGVKPPNSKEWNKWFVNAIKDWSWSYKHGNHQESMENKHMKYPMIW